APPATPASPGCNRCSIAPTTSPARASRPTCSRPTPRRSRSSPAIPLTTPMKPTPNPPPETAPLLAVGAHPDDIEFGCGGVIARETGAGREAHFVVCSRGEAGTYGKPGQRTAEAKKSAALLGATIEFPELEGDAHLEVRAVHAIKLAGIIR